MAVKSLYSLLGVGPDASPAEIESAYAGMLAKCADGSDLAPGADNQARLIAVKEAHSVLSDPTRRQVYNQKLFASVASAPGVLPNDAFTVEYGSSGSNRWLWFGALVLTAAGIALYFQHQHEQLRVQQEVLTKQLEIAKKAQQDSEDQADARSDRQKQLDQAAEANRQAQQSLMQRQQDARDNAMRAQQEQADERRQQAEQMQANRDADNKARATAMAAQQQLARDKALLYQMEVDHYGRVLVR